MKVAVVMLAAGAAALAGCQKAAEGVGTGAPRGRYVGVGHFAPGPMWSQLAAGAPKNAAAAKLSDDEQVIIVLDSTTGEVRQCGNLSGFCIGMNPWGAALPPSQVAPVQVARHASELAAGPEVQAAPKPPAR